MKSERLEVGRQARRDAGGLSSPALDRNGMEILPRAHCLRLLASRHVGRVGVSRHALPMILPVPYRMLGEDVVFATATGSKSIARPDENVIAFEVDDVDPVSRSGWSILIVGVARPLDERGPDWQAAIGLDLHPWLGHHAAQLMRLPSDRLTGRRLTGTDRRPTDRTAL
jgi:hypothetical protein